MKRNRNFFAFSCFLIGLATGAGSFALAQTGSSRVVAQPPNAIVSNQSAPAILSGNDVGVRVTGQRNGNAVGTMMIKVDGSWMDVELTTSQPMLPKH